MMRENSGWVELEPGIETFRLVILEDATNIATVNIPGTKTASGLEAGRECFDFFGPQVSSLPRLTGLLFFLKPRYRNGSVQFFCIYFELLVAVPEIQIFKAI